MLQVQKTFDEDIEHSARKLGFQRLCFTLICLIFLGCLSVKPAMKEKIKGMALESPAKKMDASPLIEMKEMGCDYICIMPYSFMEDLESTKIRYDVSWQWWGELSEGVTEIINMTHEQGMKVMLKPHLWIGDGSYTGLISIPEGDKRDSWESEYSDYILHYAAIAEKGKAEIFCIGTELCGMVKADQAYWESLIVEVKNIYSGKLTYAANWDTFKEFPWKSGMDYVGIDAYFPLTKENVPILAQVKKGWEPWKEQLSSYSDSIKMPILFTEIGYRSVDYALKEPWEQAKGGTVSNDTQTMAYEAFFHEVWNEPWLAGAFIWKWHTDSHLERKDETRFTPQGKPAMEVLKQEFLKR